MTPNHRPLLIIDGDNLAHRAYHSMPKSLRAPDGRPINAIVGWTNMLVTLWESEQPRSIYVAWDTLGVDTYRHKLWPTYQGGRVLTRSCGSRSAAVRGGLYFWAGKGAVRG
jgi:DNA polymerase-1